MKDVEAAYGFGTSDNPSAGRILEEWRTGTGPSYRVLGPNSNFSRGFAKSDNTRRIVDLALTEYATRAGGWEANGGALTEYRGTFGIRGLIDSTIDIDPRSLSHHDPEAHIIGSFRLDGQTIGRDTIRWTAKNKMSLSSFFAASALGFSVVDSRERPYKYGDTYQDIIWYTDRSGRWKAGP